MRSCFGEQVVDVADAMKSASIICSHPLCALGPVHASIPFAIQSVHCCLHLAAPLIDPRSSQNAGRFGDVDFQLFA